VERLPGFRRIWRVAGVIWGTTIIADAAVRFAWPTPCRSTRCRAQRPAVGVLFILLQVVTNVYYHRAGLYDPGSPLYAPLRQPGRTPNLAKA